MAIGEWCDHWNYGQCVRIVNGTNIDIGVKIYVRDVAPHDAGWNAIITSIAAQERTYAYVRINAVTPRDIALKVRQPSRSRR